METNDEFQFLDGLDDPELGSLKDLFKKAGSIVKNLIAPGQQPLPRVSQGGQQPIIIQQTPQQPMQSQSKSNTALIVGLSVMGIVVLGTGIYFATRNKPNLNGDETQDLGEADVVESSSSALAYADLNGNPTAKSRRAKQSKGKAILRGIEYKDEISQEQ